MSDFTTHFVTAHRFLKGKNFSKQFTEGFYYGVQGPDLLFFHKPITGGEGLALGNKVHSDLPKQLFEKDFLKLKEKNDYYKGYYFGVLLHFFGDLNMHPYIGYLCTLDSNNKYAHIMRERDIDVFTYEGEFNEPVKNFRVKDYYIYSKELKNAISEFWTSRNGNPIITPKFIKRCMTNMVISSRMFAKSNKFILGVIKIFEGKNKEGMATGHFKTTRNTEVMNYEKKPWTAPHGTVTFSVDEILDNTLIGYNKEFDKMQDNLKTNTPYVFTFDKTFDYGC